MSILSAYNNEELYNATTAAAQVLVKDISNFDQMSVQITAGAVNTDWDVSASNDGTNWTSLDSGTNLNDASVVKEYPTPTYKYIQVTITPDSSVALKAVLFAKSLD